MAFEKPECAVVIHAHQRLVQCKNHFTYCLYDRDSANWMLNSLNKPNTSHCRGRKNSEDISKFFSYWQFFERSFCPFNLNDNQNDEKISTFSKIIKKIIIFISCDILHNCYAIVRMIVWWSIYRFIFYFYFLLLIMCYSGL